MVAQHVTRLLLLAPFQIMCSDPNGFLSPKRMMEVQEELQDVLAQVLGGGHGMHKEQIQHIEHALTPLFGSLPKNRAGHLSAPVMRYAVQRYFDQENTWTLKGFESHSLTANASELSDGTQLQGKLPEYILVNLEEKFEHNGFGFKDAVGIIAALQTLTFDEALYSMQTSFKLSSLSTREELSHFQLVDVLSSYFILEQFGHESDITKHSNIKVNMLDVYPHWETTLAFILDVAENDGFARKPLSNPFLPKSFSFEDASRIAQSITKQFGPLTSHECHQIKDGLVDMDVHGTGRVTLSDFYAGWKDGSWQFRESSDFLRQLGALDESSKKLGPQVIIPNYVQSMSNCISHSTFYNICCQNECNGVYQHLEAVLPPSHDATWTAERIVGAIEEMTDQNISSSLVSRLAEVSAHHGGKIPLHGRLLAQWLHFVFPRECPYPHLPETISPKTAAQFEELFGEDSSDASEAEVAQFLESETASLAPSAEAGLEMWTPHEVTLHASTPSDTVDRKWTFRSLVQVCSIFALLCSFAVLIFKEHLPKLTQLGGQSKKSEFTI